MGVPFLNSYLKRNVLPESIKKIKLESLSGKIIVIDISIYLYRFVTDDTLMESIYYMLSLFQYYNIIPVFIFDGKAPIQKLELLEKREKEKQLAKEKYFKLKSTLEFKSNKNEILDEMQILKRKFIRLKWSDVKCVQQLIIAFGAKYIIADAEADELCAELVIKNKAYACLSEDMDLLVYGCPRVLRYLSLMGESCVLYDFNKIIDDLKMTKNDFQLICIISGTDYNLNNNYNNINLLKTINYYYQFKTLCVNNNNFYDWLKDSTNYLIKYDDSDIKSIIDIFSLINFKRDLNNFSFKYDKIDKDKIKEIMKKFGFIFLTKNVEVESRVAPLPLS